MNKKETILEEWCVMTSLEHLWRQSMMTAHDMMMHAISDINELLGNGYAAKHPELIVAYMHAANYDLRSMLEHDDRHRRMTFEDMAREREHEDRVRELDDRIEEREDRMQAAREAMATK